jgi:hypothetical protein
LVLSLPRTRQRISPVWSAALSQDRPRRSRLRPFSERFSRQELRKLRIFRVLDAVVEYR